MSTQQSGQLFPEMIQMLGLGDEHVETTIANMYKAEGKGDANKYN